MQLVIAEKPSVARDLARVLGVKGAGRHAIGDGKRVISWCIGHLVELDEPASYDARWKAWRLDALPMLPGTFKLRAVDRTRDQLRAVSELLRDRKFSEVVNACDAGREGELIFRYVYELCGARLPVRRLWISSMTDEAIERGFATLKPGRDYEALADAARCRSEADWLVGMNATRAVTITHRTSTVAPAPRQARGAPNERSPVYSIGRVQTPTLAIVVERELAITKFQPKDYWEVRGTFSTAGHSGGTSFTAGWGTRSETTKGGNVSRLGTRALGDALVARTVAHATAADPSGPLVELVRARKGREPPPQLFDLTTLQRTANRRYGLSATSTLEAAQALYERHKLLTYPRTDSRHLTSDLVAEMPKLFRGLTQCSDYAPFAQTLLAGPPPARSKRVFDDAKVHDHHAIIPTGKITRLDALSSDERRVFDLVVRRFLGVFFPDAEFALTDVVIRVGAGANGGPARGPTEEDVVPAADETVLSQLPAPPDRFFTRGRVRVVAGWQEVAQIGEGRPTEERLMPGVRQSAGKGANADPDTDSTMMLPPLVQGQRLDGAFESLAKQTKPPPRHTEATLLGAMEYAGRDIEDETLRAAMKETGLGTPATRAATIETLVRRSFIVRQGKQIVATPTGIALIEGLPVASLASPELTGSWEARLARIARGKETRAAFMGDIARYVTDVVNAIRNSDGRKGNGGHPSAPAARAPAIDDKAARRRAAAPSRAARSVLAAKSPPATSAASTPVVAALTCPRCRQGALVTGKRGWGCARWREGCAFVIWFEAAGRRLTEAQLRDLVAKGKTRKTTWSSPSGQELPGRLVLDVDGALPAGAARFEPV